MREEEQEREIKERERPKWQGYVGMRGWEREANELEFRVGARERGAERSHRS